jgi:hypothetical protein
MGTPAGTQSITSPALSLVDPQAPASASAIEAAGQWLLQTVVTEAVIDSAARTFRNRSARYVVYAKANRFYKLDLRRGTGLPAPTLLGSASTSQLCPTPAATFSDDSDADNSSVVFATPGADGQCQTADDGRVAIPLSSSSTTAPVAVGQVLDAIRSPAGAITGYVVKSGNVLQRVNAQFGSPTTLVALGGGTFSSLGVTLLSSGHAVLVYQDGTALQRVDLSSGAGPASLANLGANETATRLYADDSQMLVCACSSGTSRLLRVVDATSTQLASATLARITAAEPSSTHAVYQTDTGTSKAVLTVALAGGSFGTIAQDSAVKDGPAFSIAAFAVSGDNVVVQMNQVRGTASPNSFRVITRSADGTGSPQTMQNAMVVGMELPNPASLLTRVGRQPATWNIVQGEATGTSPFSGGTLLAVDGTTRSTRVTYGRLAAGSVSSAVSLWPLQSGLPGLVFAIGSVGGSSAADLYAFKSGTAGLTRSTSVLP